MRPDYDTYFSNIAKVVSTRASCARRAVGCVVVNSKQHIIATGYNGPASGLDNCTDNPCAGADMASGTGLQVCQAVHAEMNALMQCKDVYDIETIYCTTQPCTNCFKLIMSTSCKRVVFVETYADLESFKLAKLASIELCHLK